MKSRISIRNYRPEERKLLLRFISIDMHGNNLEEKTLRIIQEHLQEKHWILKHLNRQQKKDLVQTLFKKGIFNFKDAVPFVAKYLDMSRTSVYNYIRLE